MPSPVLEPTDPLFEHVLRLAGMSIDPNDATLIDCGEGLKVGDVIAACYMNRDEVAEYDAVLYQGQVRADDDGWAVDTEVSENPTTVALPLDDAKSQALFGYWTLADPPPDTLALNSRVFIRGFNYDMYASAATACDMLAERMKLQFDFNDGSGSYPRSQKYAQTKQCAADLWKRARPRVVSLSRDDTPGGTFWQEVEGEFVAQDWWGWAS